MNEGWKRVIKAREAHIAEINRESQAIEARKAKIVEYTHRSPMGEMLGEALSGMPAHKRHHKK